MRTSEAPAPPIKLSVFLTQAESRALSAAAGKDGLSRTRKVQALIRAALKLNGKK